MKTVVGLVAIVAVIGLVCGGLAMHKCHLLSAKLGDEGSIWNVLNSQGANIQNIQETQGKLYRAVFPRCDLCGTTYNFGHGLTETVIVPNGLTENVCDLCRAAICTGKPRGGDNGKP